jgi:alginate O-acetyltransferase complex protein AlgI
MIFSSIEFIIFFLIFVLTLKLFKQSQRNLIIIFSLVFYSFWNYYFVLLILYFCFLTFFLIKTNVRLSLGIILLLIPLIYFKYSYFLTNTFGIDLFSSFVYKGEIPLAISFITFTAIASIIDIKNKIFDKQLIKFFSITEFILFFPQLIAGPILRLNELLPKLQNKIFFSKDNIKFGLILFLIGFSKKIFIADNIAEIIDPIFLNPDNFSSDYLFKSFLLFPLQIYFDFSGYIDMALGASIILGIELPVNFNKPYLTYSLTEFWRNWHMTLSRWFKDYVYIPLGGSKHSKIKTFRNIIITMSIAGIWHGASFNFVVWGFLNGLILCIERIFGFYNSKNILRILFNCFIIFNLWVVFRITEMNKLVQYFSKLYGSILEIFNIENFLIVLIVIGAITSQKIDNFISIKNFSKRTNLLFVIIFFIFVILDGLGINVGRSEKFIYFQF